MTSSTLWIRMRSSWPRSINKRTMKIRKTLAGEVSAMLLKEAMKTLTIREMITTIASKLLMRQRWEERKSSTILLTAAARAKSTQLTMIRLRRQTVWCVRQLWKVRRIKGLTKIRNCSKSRISASISSNRSSRLSISISSNRSRLSVRISSNRSSRISTSISCNRRMRLSISISSNLSNRLSTSSSSPFKRKILLTLPKFNKNQFIDSHKSQWVMNKNTNNQDGKPLAKIRVEVEVEAHRRPD